MFNTFKTFCISLFALSLFALPSVVSANIPNFSGHVYFVNQDGSKTSNGVAGVYVKWTDNGNHFRFAKTDASGKFSFPDVNEERITPNHEAVIKQLFRTWIKPDQPEIAAVQSDSDLSSQGYSRMRSIDLYVDGLSCTYNSHSFTVIKPLVWTGQFTEAETNWRNDDGNAITTSKVANPFTITNVNFNNSQNFNGDNFIANFYYKPSAEDLKRFSPPPSSQPVTPPASNTPSGSTPTTSSAPFTPPACTANPNLGVGLQFLAINNENADVLGLNKNIRAVVSRDPDKATVISIPIFYQDSLCQEERRIIKIKYVPNASGGPNDPNNPDSSSNPSTPPASPQPCSSSSNKKDGCSCTQASECYGRVCENAQTAGVCKTPQSIQVEGGDAHSNKTINIGGDN